MPYLYLGTTGVRGATPDGNLSERSGEQMIWYGNNALMRLKNGETGIIGTTTEVSKNLY